MNGQGAICALLTGFVMGAVRFVYEVLDKTQHYQSSAIRGMLDINFLHYAILMFVVCSIVLIGVSMFFPAPSREKIAGLTFATVDDKIDTKVVKTAHLERESRRAHNINLAFTAVLLVTVVSLWIYFR
jgi:SSS family solute:Na+ symporter